MKLHKLILGIILCSLILPLSGATKARADIGPPTAPKGGSINPGEETTMVQMVSETVEIEVTGEYGVYAKEEWSEYKREYNGYEALVNASFTMRNQGDEEEQMAVHFPLNIAYKFEPDYGTPTLIQNFRVFVSGQELDWTLGEYTYSELAWAIFDVTFPPQKNVNVRVRYTTYSPSWPWPYEPEFFYFLETGAGWYGPIKNADIILKMPYRATTENVFEYPEGAEFIGSEVRWHYENLEPTSENNWSVKVIRPGMWNYFSNKQKVAQNNPDDVDAWVEYALACHYLSINDHKDWIFSENGAYFFDYCKQAFAHAEELGANSVDFHTGIALNLYLDEVLNRTGYYNVDINSPSIQKALFHLDKALFLDFENQLAREIFSYIKFSTGKDLPDPGPSITPSPTRTKVPTRTITKTPTASPTIPINIPVTITSPTPTPRLRTPTSTATSTTTTATLTPSPIPPTATLLPPTLTPTPQPEVAGDNNAWLVGAIALVALVALIGGGFVWVWVEKQKA